MWINVGDYYKHISNIAPNPSLSIYNTLYYDSDDTAALASTVTYLSPWNWSKLSLFLLSDDIWWAGLTVAVVLMPGLVRGTYEVFRRQIIYKSLGKIFWGL